MWLQGLYVYEAIGDMAPILRPFAKHGTKPIEYPAEPYAIDEAEREARKKRDDEAKAEELRIKLKQWAQDVNKKFNKEEVEDDAKRTDGTDRHRDSSGDGERVEEANESHEGIGQVEGHIGSPVEPPGSGTGGEAGGSDRQAVLEQ